MKNLLIASVLLYSGASLAAGPAPAAPVSGKVSLLCTGWLPVYASWEAPPAPTAVQGGQITVEIDRATNMLSTSLPVTGEVSAPLEVNARAYGATAPQGRVHFGRSLDAVEISVNRVNGEARMRYMVGETAYPAFNGSCTLAKGRS